MASGGTHPDIASFLNYQATYDVNPDGEDLAYDTTNLQMLAEVASLWVTDETALASATQDQKDDYDAAYTLFLLSDSTFNQAISSQSGMNALIMAAAEAGAPEAANAVIGKQVLDQDAQSLLTAAADRGNARKTTVGSAAWRAANPFTMRLRSRGGGQRVSTEKPTIDLIKSGVRLGGSLNTDLK